MTPRPTPPIATWFLAQFGSNTENESMIGDLVEQYQRGRGSLWYWRQVLSIVFVALFREVRLNKRSFFAGLFQTWCIWGGLQFAAALVLMARFILLHPEQLRDGISVYGLPMLTLHSRMTAPYVEQVEIMLLSVFLNVLTLLATGVVCSRRTSRISPRIILLAFITTYIVVNVGLTLTIGVEIVQHQPNAAGFLLIRALIALPLAPALILIGGMRGLSPVSPHFKR